MPLKFDLEMCDRIHGLAQTAMGDSQPIPDQVKLGLLKIQQLSRRLHSSLMRRWLVEQDVQRELRENMVKSGLLDKEGEWINNETDLS